MSVIANRLLSHIENGLFIFDEYDIEKLSDLSDRQIYRLRCLIMRDAVGDVDEDTRDTLYKCAEKLDNELFERGPSVSTSPVNRKITLKQTDKKVLMECHCGKQYVAKRADLKRGWGLSCSKSCAALRRSRKWLISKEVS